MLYLTVSFSHKAVYQKIDTKTVVPDPFHALPSHKGGWPDPLFHPPHLFHQNWDFDISRKPLFFSSRNSNLKFQIGIVSKISSKNCWIRQQFGIPNFWPILMISSEIYRIGTSNFSMLMRKIGLSFDSNCINDYLRYHWKNFKYTTFIDLYKNN